MRLKIFLLITLTPLLLFAQSESSQIATVVPFLNMTSNPRINSFGEIGTVTSNFYRDGGFLQNPALLSRKGKNYGVGISRRFYGGDFNDMSLFNFEGYSSINEKHTLGYSYSRFSLGEIQYRQTVESIPITSMPIEQFHQFLYSVALTESFSFGAVFRYFTSDFGAYIENMQKLRCVALNVGFEYKKTKSLSSKAKLNYHVGGAISNLGPKVSYDINSEIKEFIPTNLSLAALLNPEFNVANESYLSVELAYQMEKLLVPSPQPLGGVDDSDDYSALQGVFQSFSDAPNGMSEELQELVHKIGTEVRFNSSDKFYVALRLGKLFEHEYKGNRNYITNGLGLGYMGFFIDYSSKFDMGAPQSAFNYVNLRLGFRSSFTKPFRF